MRGASGRPLEILLWVHDLGPYLAAGIFFMLGGVPLVRSLAEKHLPPAGRTAVRAAALAGLLALTLLSVSVLVNSSYNPFLYFNF